MDVVADFVCNGVFWDALSSVATIAATFTALYLARRDNIKRMDAVLIWDQIENYKPALYISNIGNKPIPMKSISLYYKGKLFFNSNVLEDFKTNTFSRYLLLPNASQKINLDPHAIKITGVKRPNGNKSVFVPKVKIIIRDMSGKTYVFRQKMQEAKMGEAIFGAAFFSKED